MSSFLGGVWILYWASTSVPGNLKSHQAFSDEQHDSFHDSLHRHIHNVRRTRQALAGVTSGLAQTARLTASIVSPAFGLSMLAFSVERHLLGGYAVYGIFFFLSCLAVITSTAVT